MKKTLKFLSLAIICTILVSTLPLNETTRAQSTGETLIESFDNVTEVSSVLLAEDLGSQVSADLDNENKYSQTGKSIKITTIPANEAKYRRARLKNISASDSAALGFKIWMKNPSTSTIGIAVQFIDESGKWINMQPGTAYFTVDAAGQVSQYTYRRKADGTTEGCISLESGFEGFVYLPLVCGYSSVTADKVSTIALSAYTLPDAPVSYYIDALASYTEVGGENWIIRRFSEYNTTAEMKTQMYIHGTQTVELDAENDACIIDTGTKDTKSGVSFSFKGNAIFNEHMGMKVRIKNSDHGDTDILYKWETTEHRPLKSKASYFLVDTNGTIYSKKASSNNEAARVTLPAGFDGWLYVPFSSAYSMKYSDIYRLYLNADILDLPGRKLSVYEISLYKELPVTEGASFVIDDFEGYTTTQNLKDTLVYGDTTKIKIELDKDAWNSQGLKMTQQEKANEYTTAVAFGASDIAKQFDGFKIRIKTNQNANMLIKSEDTAHRPMKAKSLYYLVSSDGRAYSYKTSTDEASYVQLSKGFDGWIYIPFSSLSGIDPAKACRVWFNLDKTNSLGTEFVLDDIVLYSGNPTVINDTPIEFVRVLPYTPDDNILDFDSCNSTEEMLKKIKLENAENVTVELDSTVSRNMNSSKFMFSEDGGAVRTIVEFEKNSYYGEITGFRFWIKASEADESVSLLYKLETSEHRPLKSKAIYYLVDNSGLVIRRNASADNTAAIIAIPAGFEGWIYVPFDSIYPMKIEDLYRMWFNFTAGANASKTIWIDSISCYKDNPIVKETDIINDFNIYSGTSDLILDSNFIAESDKENYLISKNYIDGKSGKSLKIKTVKGNYKFSGFSGLEFSKYHGFVFYVNNPSSKEAYLLPQTDSEGRDSFIPGKVYYLENKKTGAVEMKNFNKLIIDAGNIEIPAGFEGYVYLPYSSAYPSLQKHIQKLNAFWITIPSAIATDTEIYIDTIAFYENTTCRISNILVWRPDTTGMLYGFEKNDSVAGYRGWITNDKTLDVSITNKYSHSGKNSLKISTPITSIEESKNNWAVTNLSLKNEDGSYNDASMYDGIGLWIRVEKDGTTTKPVEDKVSFGFKVDMPSHARFYSTSPIYILEDGKETTNPEVFTVAVDGCMKINLSPGFAGMVYIPYSTIQSFNTDELTTSQLHNIFVMFQLHSLIGYNVYIDDIQGYNIKNLKNVAWPGDATYDPLADPMFKIIALSGQTGADNVPDIKDFDDGSNKNIFKLWLWIGIAMVVLVVSIGTVLILKNKKKKN